MKSSYQMAEIYQWIPDTINNQAACIVGATLSYMIFIGLFGGHFTQSFFFFFQLLIFTYNFLKSLSFFLVISKYKYNLTYFKQKAN